MVKMKQKKGIFSMIRHSDAICLIRNFKAYYQSDNAVGDERKIEIKIRKKLSYCN